MVVKRKRQAFWFNSRTRPGIDIRIVLATRQGAASIRIQFRRDASRPSDCAFLEHGAQERHTHRRAILVEVVNQVRVGSVVAGLRRTEWVVAVLSHRVGLQEYNKELEVKAQKERDTGKK